MTLEDLRRLQKTELEILLDFDAYCRAHGLRYYLIGGALLGAVRYQKFIPWDDDVDVAMPREDYECLKQTFTSEKYFLQNAQSDPGFSRCIQKLRKNGTQIVEFACRNANIHQGIYLDIFPIDYVPEYDVPVLASRGRRIRRLMSLRAIKGGYEGKRFPKLKRLIKAFCPLSLGYLDRRIDQLCTKENHLERNYGVLWLHNYSWDKQTHLMKTFGSNGKCCFEGHMFSAPADVDGFLRRVFGEDYLIEPEPKKQKCPHSYLNVVF